MTEGEYMDAQWQAHVEENDEHQEIIEEAQRHAMSQARMQADKIVKKNSRELERLNIHAQKSVLDNNFEAYKYAIEKSRKILRQPFNDELIRVQWETTRRQIWEILNGYKAG